MVSVTGNGLGQPHLMPHQKENMIQESKIQNNRRIPNYCLLRQLRDQMQILNIRNFYKLFEKALTVTLFYNISWKQTKDALVSNLATFRKFLWQKILSNYLRERLRKFR